MYFQIDILFSPQKQKALKGTVGYIESLTFIVFTCLTFGKSFFIAWDFFFMAEDILSILELDEYGQAYIISLAIQWLRLCAPKEGGIVSILGQGTKIPHAMWSNQKLKKKKKV